MTTGISPLQIYRNIMSAEQRQSFDDCFERRLRSLPLRVRALVGNCEHPVETIINLFGRSTADYATLCPPGHEMRKTIARAREFGDDMRREFYNIANADSHILLTRRVERSYPFLFKTSRRFVTDRLHSGERLPLFHIIEQYLRHSRLRDDRIYRIIRGISHDKRVSARALADEYGISSERVRQIAEAGPAMTGQEWYRKADAGQLYPELKNVLYISNAPGNPLERIRTEESVAAGARNIVRLMPLLFGMTLYEQGELSIAVQAALCDKINVRRLMAVMNDTVGQRRNDAHVTDIAVYLHENGFTADADTCALACHIAVNAFGCVPRGDSTIELPRTFIDVSAECYRILSDHGHVMHISEIFDKFKQRFPDHRFTSPDQLRRMLWMHPAIRAVGKQSTYGLDSWNDVYYGSIRDLLTDILAASDRPVPVDRLLVTVRQHYPDVTAASLYSTMTGDTRRRFVQYSSGFGLAGITYADATRKTPYRSRHDFDRRLADFMQFISRERRYPQRDSGTTSDENALYNWRANILSGRLRIDDKQRKEFDRAIGSIPVDIPRTRTECVFRERTDLVALCCGDTGRLDPRLMRWLKSVLQTDRPYGDSRDTCVARLRTMFG